MVTRARYLHHLSSAPSVAIVLAGVGVVDTELEIWPGGAHVSRGRERYLIQTNFDPWTGKTWSENNTLAGVNPGISHIWVTVKISGLLVLTGAITRHEAWVTAGTGNTGEQSAEYYLGGGEHKLGLE